MAQTAESILRVPEAGSLTSWFPLRAVGRICSMPFSGFLLVVGSQSSVFLGMYMHHLNLGFFCTGHPPCVQLPPNFLFFFFFKFKDTHYTEVGLTQMASS